jgi:hypothetical protein
MESIIKQLHKLHEDGKLEWINGKIPTEDDIETKFLTMYKELKGGGEKIIQDLDSGLVMYKGNITPSFWIGITRWEFIDDKDVFIK